MKLRVLILEAEGAEAIKELLSIVPLQFTSHGAEVPTVPMRDAPPPPKQIPTAKPEKSTGAHAAQPAIAPVRKRGPTPNYSMYPLRTATARHPSCVLCPRPIEVGEQYHDGGAPSYRVHIACAEKAEAKAA